MTCTRTARLSNVGKIKLMGSHEIAERLGVSRDRAYDITTKKGFPDPYQTLRMGSVWDAAEVEAWIRVHRPHLVLPEPGETEEL